MKLITIKSTLFIVFLSISFDVFADHFPVDLANFLLRNQPEIERQINFQVRLITHDDFGPRVKAAWDNELPGRPHERSKSDFIVWRAAQQRDVDFTKLATPVETIASRRTNVYGWVDLQPMQHASKGCVLPHVPYVLLGLLPVHEAIPAEGLITIERAFDALSPVYGAFFDILRDYLFVPDPRPSAGATRFPNGTTNQTTTNLLAAEPGSPSQCKSARSDHELISAYFPHLTNGFGSGSDFSTKELAILADERLFRTRVETFSVSQLSLLLRMLEFFDQHDSFINITQPFGGFDAIGLIERMVEEKALDFDDLDSSSGETSRDDDEFNFHF